MIQNIIVILIVVAALAYTVYSVLKSVTRKKDESPCGGCTGCDIRHELNKNRPGGYTNACSGPK